jgi:hypothetical protein
MQKLRQMGLLQKEDIQSYELLEKLIENNGFAENRLRILIEWDPTLLTRLDVIGEVPLHNAALIKSMQIFQLVLEYGIRYYPIKKGITVVYCFSKKIMKMQHPSNGRATQKDEMK